MSPVRAQGAADSTCACAGDASKLGILGGAWAAVQVGSVQAMRGRGPGEEPGFGEEPRRERGSPPPTAFGARGVPPICRKGTRFRL